MDTIKKLKILGEGAKYDVCASTASSKNKFYNSGIGNVSPAGICHSFTPDGRCTVGNTPLAQLSATSLIRENRLYQSDFLLRLYGFQLNELVFDSLGNLDQELDPKLSYALQHPELFPLEINKASYRALLKIPGIGPRSAMKIIQTRRQHRFTSPIELKNIGLVLKRALSFITINGRFYGNKQSIDKPQRELYQQLSLWGDNRDFMLTKTFFND